MQDFTAACVFACSALPAYALAWRALLPARLNARLGAADKTNDCAAELRAFAHMKAWRMCFAAPVLPIMAMMAMVMKRLLVTVHNSTTQTLIIESDADAPVAING